LLSRAGGRLELLVHFSAGRGYEVWDWNREAAELFGLDLTGPHGVPLGWTQLPTGLAEYLAQALQSVSGAPVEAMPELKKPDRTYFAKVFYEGVPADAEREEEHWYFFCFQDSVSLLDNSQGEVNRKKLETIGELASGVAHDFNNLIMGIQSNAEAMLAQPSLSPQARDSIVNIIRACSNGASLTRSLLGYAKKQPLTLTPFNLVDLIHDVARIAGMASGATHNHSGYRIALGKDFQEGSDPIMVVGSFSSLSHCLLNLIKNAREAMPDGGTIHVLWEGNDTTSTVTVRDHGAGIAEQDLAHIFEPFYSTKKQGTGLGLAMVRGIISQHAGTVEIRSTVGMGTSVSLVWPRGEVAAKPVKDKESTHVADSSRRVFRNSSRIIMQSQKLSPECHFLIYVIDDDDLVRDGLCSLLEHLGHKTHSFRHPEVALQALLTAEVAPEVVIVDYNMPGMNGAQFISRYSTAVAGTSRMGESQLMLMSGLPPSHFEDFMSEFAELKLSVLEKPFTLDTLRKKLAAIQQARQAASAGKATTSIPAAAVGIPHVIPRPNAGALTGKLEGVKEPVAVAPQT
jgi:signal transduction histidine kinase/CheY-like chemotaxis protein